MTKMSSLNYMELCRLCLVKEKVSVPIFEGEGGERQIFDKIATCLPVKVSQDDKLPKKICSDCVYRVENSYQFWNTTSNSEKQLLEWVVNDVKVDTKSNITMETEQLVLKEEAIDHDQTAADVAKSLSRVEAVLTEETGQPGGVSEEEEEEEDSDDGGGGGGGEDSNSEESGEEPPGKEEIESEEEEEEEEPYEELEPTTFVNVSLACDEAGPSGIQQTRQQTKQDSQASAASASATTENAEAPSTSAADPAASGFQKPLSLTFPGLQPFVTAADWQTQAVPPHLIFNQSENLPKPEDQKTEELTSKIKKYLYLNDKKINNENIYSQCISSTDKLYYMDSKCVSGDLEEEINSDNVRGIYTTDKETSSIIYLESKVDTRRRLNAKTKTDRKRSVPNVKQGRKRLLVKSKTQIKKNSTRVKVKLLSNSLDSLQALKRYPCDVCGRNFPLESILADHMLEHDGALKESQEYPCPTCGRVYKQKSKLKTHMVRHSDVRNFPCDMCGKMFKRRFEVDKHKKLTHSNEKRHSCSLCGYKAYHLSQIKHHEKRHVGGFNYKCEDCDRSYPLQSELKAHRISCHNDEPYKCPTCLKSYGIKRNFDTHLKTHEPGYVAERKFQCESCGNTYRHKSDLIKHRLKHTGEKKYVCKVCEKSVASQGSLIAHMRIHTGEKPYVCDICGKAFSSYDYLKAHLRTHTGEKPYSCEICNKSFSQQSTLTVHRRYHTGQRPYVCSICSQGFVTKTLLSTHSKTHSFRDDN